MPDDQGAGLALDRHRLRIAEIAGVGRHDALGAYRVAAPLVTTRHDRRAAVLPIEIGQPVCALADDGLLRQRRRHRVVGVQPERALVWTFHPAGHGRQHRVVAAEIRCQGEHHGVHQRFFEHRILEQERMHHVADGRVAIAAVSTPHAAFGPSHLDRGRHGLHLHVRVRGAGLEVGPLAVAPLGDIEHGFEHPTGKAVRARDLGRDDRVAVGVEIGNVALQAKLANVVPCTIEAGLQGGCWFRHDSVLPDTWLHSTPGRRTPRSPRRYCPNRLFFRTLDHGGKHVRTNESRSGRHRGHFQ